MAILTDEHIADAYHHQTERVFDDAPFVWLQRSRAVNQPHYDRTDLAALDRRLGSLVEALLTTPQQAWSLCAQALPTASAGEVFVAAAIAFRGSEVRCVQQAVEAGLSSESRFPGLLSALAWLPDSIAHPWIHRFLRSKQMDHKHLAVAAYSARCEDPADELTLLLQREDCLSHHKLYCGMLRLAGELKRVDLLPAVQRARHADHPDVKFWAHWATVLLGDADAAHALRPFIAVASAHRAAALDLCMRVLPLPTARQWISAWALDHTQVRTTIQAIGVLGDPLAVDWLLPKIRAPETARLAGEAFATITGIDLVEQKLTRVEEPLHPASDEDHLELSADQFLPVPDADAMTTAWRTQQDAWVAGQRYFLGKPIERTHLEHIYANGRQRQRRAAAMELALADPQRPLDNYARMQGFSDHP